MSPSPSHNRRAAGQTATTISLSSDVLEYVKQQAAAEDRSVSYWLRRLIERELRSHLDTGQSVAETSTVYTAPKRRKRR